jgi:penicillin-binding protein 2
VAKYKIAGKTGTAQVFGIKQDEEYVAEDIDKHLRDHALFIGFAPVENPRIAIAVVVENGGSGGAVAAPIARKIMDHYLESLSNEQSGTAAGGNT